MASKPVTAAILLLLTMNARAQGVVSSIARPAPSPPALPPPLPVPSMTGPWNPFVPHAAIPPTTAPITTSTAHAPIDPTQAALEAREREIREHGVRLGEIDGQVIYRHEGHYLIEPDTRGHTAKSNGPLGPKRDPAECVIRVIHLSAEKPADNADQAPGGIAGEHAINAESKPSP